MKGTLGYKIRTIICTGCGRVITAHASPRKKFCSHECYAKSPKPARKTGRHVSCEQCGSEFYAIASRSARFCSAACHNTWQSRNKHAYCCKTCSREFLWSPSRRERSKVTYCSLACRDADPERTAMLLEMNVKQARLRPNALECAAYAMLDSMGVAYDRQVLIGGKFCVDTFVPTSRLVIQFDGDYWHGNPAKFPEPDARQKRRMQLDRSQDAYMAACGYRVLRLWESEIKRHPEASIARVAAALQERVLQETPSAA